MSSTTEAQLRALLLNEDQDVIQVRPTTTGELRVTAMGPYPEDILRVTLQSGLLYNLLSLAERSWWLGSVDLFAAARLGWLVIDETAPSESGAVIQPIVPYIPAPATAVAGDIIVYSGTEWVVLPAGADGYALTSNGASLAPSYQAAAAIPEATTSTAGLLSAVDKTKLDGSTATLTYAATLALDFSPALPPVKSVVLTGNVTFTSANLASGRGISLRIDPGASIRTFTFPLSWRFVGSTAPISIAASKLGILSLTAFGTADSDVIAAYAVEG